MGGSYRGRVALEWRAAMLVAAVAVLVAVLARFPGVGDAVWLLLGPAGVVVLVGLGLAVNARFRPVVPPAAVSGRWRDRDVAAARKRVTRGRSVEPPELRAAAITQARRELRFVHLNIGWLPVLGCAWSLRIGEGGVSDGPGYFGIVAMLFAIVALGWSGVVRTRLDRVESGTADAAAPATGPDALNGSGADR